MSDASVTAAILARAPDLARLVSRFGKTIARADVLVRRAVARGVTPELARALEHRFRAEARAIERAIDAELAARRLSDRDAKRLRGAVAKARLDLAAARLKPKAPQPPSKPQSPFTADDVATREVVRQLSEGLVAALRRELDPATLKQLARLTPDDWDAIVRRAVEMDTAAVRNLKGMIQELFTKRLPAFRRAVADAKKQFDAFTGAEGWNFDVWHGIQALDGDGRTIRDFADKGAFAFIETPKLNWAIPLMFWEDKNESNVRDLLGRSGQVARLDVRSRHGLIRHQGKDYFVSEQIMRQLFPRIYGAAPAIPGARGFATLPKKYRAVTRIYKSPLSSATLADVAKRVFRFVGR